MNPEPRSEAVSYSFLTGGLVTERGIVTTRAAERLAEGLCARFLEAFGLGGCDLGSLLWHWR